MLGGSSYPIGGRSWGCVHLYHRPRRATAQTWVTKLKKAAAAAPFGSVSKPPVFSHTGKSPNRPGDSEWRDTSGN